jgi:hypothetical protein
MMPTAPAGQRPELGWASDRPSVIPHALAALALENVDGISGADVHERADQFELLTAKPALPARRALEFRDLLGPE